MLAITLIHAPLLLLPMLQLPPPPGDCLLEVLAPQVREERARADFDERVHTYMALQRRLARALAPMDMFDDEERGVLAEELRTALIDARPHARAGGFFTPGVIEVFTRRIDAVLLGGVVDLAVPLYVPLPGQPGPAVNEPFPFVAGSVRWPAVTRALPELPRELEYVFWGRDLVLVDTFADLVLDVLPDALPEGAGPGVIYP